MREIYKRVYDAPVDKDGKEKPNELLGTFEVLQQISEDMYEEQFIGIRKEDGKKYLVTGTEVSDLYNPGVGGMRYEINEITV